MADARLRPGTERPAWSGLNRYVDRFRLGLSALSFPGAPKHYNLLLDASQKSAEAKLGFQVKFSNSTRKGETTIEIHDAERKALSSATYRSTDGGLTLVIYDVKTSPDFQKKGLSQLLAKMLAENPRTQRIKTSLQKTNQSIFEQAIAQGRSPAEAFLETPAYKIRARFGFTKIKVEQYWSHRNFVVERG